MALSAESFNEEQVVIFNLHDQVYGINIASVVETIKMQPITKVPGAMDLIEGVINLRGKVIPIMDLRKRLGLLTSDTTPDTRIVILECGGVSIGVMVDAVSEVRTIPSSFIENPPDMVLKSGFTALKGIALVNERLIMLLDPGNLLHDEEKLQLKELKV